ncbi:MAG: RluA family pseudouridine synthase [Clostridiales bacterium]|nr:RluA family pseudouridine synthase [Clostridiales bacterium]
MNEQINGDIYRFEISQESTGVRLDKFLSEHLGGFSRSFVQKLIENGDVIVNGRVQQKESYKTKASDVIEVDVPKPVELSVEAEDIPLNVVFEDEHMIVINKPQGMVTHPAVGNMSGTLVNALMHHCKDCLSGINGVMRPGIVHRLDKDTSGLLVVAKTDTAHLSLSEQISTKSASRIYFAVVENNFTSDSGVIETQIGRNPSDRLKMAVLPAGTGRYAKTEYTVLERFGEFTYVRLKLYTGRTHQIRVHMSHYGHPIYGDRTYGSNKTREKGNGQFLHAGILELNHPVTGERMKFTAPIPGYFEELLDKLRNKRK